MMIAAPLRSVVVSLLTKVPCLDVICEVQDGLAAVEKARELKPDLILLDIGLPKLNGLEAARQILDLTPSVKIVFLTQNTDIEVVREAFRIGALGYVHKQKAESDLLPAINAVLRSERFVSSGLGKGEFKRRRT